MGIQAPLRVGSPGRPFPSTIILATFQVKETRHREASDSVEATQPVTGSVNSPRASNANGRAFLRTTKPKGVRGHTGRARLPLEQRGVKKSLGCL